VDHSSQSALLGDAVTDSNQRGAIGFAEKVLELLDEGRYTATYKYALLLALMDVCLEHTQSSGAAPQMVTTRQLADKIVEFYWPHTVPFVGVAPATVLKQNTTGQAEIISAITRFRARHASDPSVPRWESRIMAPGAYERLVRLVEWKLIEMPLPRLQIMGQSHRPFIYEIYWDQRVERREVTRYQVSAASGFDNRVMLRPGVGENGLLRPLIQRRWAAMIAQLNRLEESQQVDHFVPWSRYPDDTLDNFVVADNRCNEFKSSSLAAADHLARWTRRFVEGSREHAQLADLTQTAGWVRQPDRSLNVARAIYLRLPRDARLWLPGKEFVPPDSGMIGTALNVR
jgi:hypothetical protein